MHKWKQSLILFTLFCSVRLGAQVINIVGPAGSVDFGYSLTTLTNGNYVITDPYFNDGPVLNAGAVYLYDGRTHSLISTLKGKSNYDAIGTDGVIALNNGNFIIISRYVDNGTIFNCGAITWVNGVTGLSGVVTPENSLFGTAINDSLGSGDFNGHGGVVVLDNGNYIVVSPKWDNGSVVDAGAVTLLNGNNPTSGVISAANSLVGSSTNDKVGSHGIFVLDNNHFLVRSSFWNNGTTLRAGAITWCNGVELSGQVSSANSLVGTTTDDFIDHACPYGYGAVKLANGNFVVINPSWDDASAGIVDAGAVTWGSNVLGLSGVINSGNSLVGSTPFEQVGGCVGQENTGGVTALSNGNYVVATPGWDNGPLVDAGAVTWGNGNTGVTGKIDVINSLVGSSASDEVGSSRSGWCGVVPLTNGNYVVGTAYWNNGSSEDVGAVTWADGNTGIAGEITEANSMVGNTSLDFKEYGSNYRVKMITALSNGNYVISTPNWDNGSVVNAGAVTWANGFSIITGKIDGSRSLIGTRANDEVGYVTALPNGNYVVCSPYWDNGDIPDAGSVTWANGITGITGFLNSSNSLIGSHPNDNVGGANKITVLTNGNYVISSENWDNDAAVDAGAATWANGLTGITGIVDQNNSLVGTTTDDRLAYIVTPLSNGNYVVSSPIWNNGSAAVGAVTWGNGSIGISGPVNSINSLVGSHMLDYVGWVIPLDNGNYLVTMPEWDNTGPGNSKGALTWGNGATGTAGIVSSANSLVGTMQGDIVGLDILTSAQNYLAISNYWDNGSITDAGAITIGSTSSGVSGEVTNCNSVTGKVADNGSRLKVSVSDVFNYVIVGQASPNMVSILQPSAAGMPSTADSAFANINGNVAVPLVTNAGCNLIATLKPNGANPVHGNVTAKSWLEPDVPMHNGYPFIARHYEITPGVNAGAATGRITLYFSQQDFDDFNAHPGSTLNAAVDADDAIGIANIRIGKFAGESSDGTGVPATYTGPFTLIDPADEDIVWNPTLHRWEISFDVTGFSGFILQTNAPSLPLTLLEFAGQLVNDDAILKWKTTDEFNTSSFDIERSTDGRSFITIGNVTATNQPGIHTYFFNDNDLSALGVPLVYYRLKSIDMDGRFTHSAIVTLMMDNKITVSFYPNPAKSNVTLAVILNEPMNLNLYIMDDAGRIIKRDIRSALAGKNTWQIDVSGLSNGIYYLELKGNQVNQRIRFIKM